MMNKDIKFEGIIEKVNPPRFNSKTFYYVINVKVNDKWQYVWRRRETDALNTYNAILELKNEQSAKTDKKHTILSSDLLRDCEIAVDRLNTKYSSSEVEDRRLVLDAVDFFIKNTPSLKTPYVAEAGEMFIREREKICSPVTIRDYNNVLQRLSMVYGERRISTISTKDMREYLEEFENVKRRASHIYLKAFFEFCCGKNNPYTEGGSGWLNSNPICWSLPKMQFNDPDVFDFQMVVKLLMLCNSDNRKRSGINPKRFPYSRYKHELIAYYIFRLFSCLRKEEFIRLLTIGGGSVDKNKFIDLERGRLLITPEIYKKKGAMSGSSAGRKYDPLPDVFMEWLNWMVKNDIKLTFPRGHYTELEVRQVCKELDLKSFNIMRHTAITFHLLNFKQPNHTAKIAGTSLRCMEDHYVNKNMSVLEGEKFYQLNPTKAKEMSLILI